MIYDKLKVYNDGGMIVFQDNTASIPFLSEPKGSVRIRPFGANGFSFEYLVNGEPIGSVNNYDDVLDSSGVVYGASQLAVLTALNSFFFELGGGDLDAVLTAGNNAGANDIDLNNNDLLNTDKIDFNLATTDTAGVGQIIWNDEDGTLDLGLKGGNVTLQVGQEEVVRVVNKTGGNLLEAEYKAVRIRTKAEGGAQGQRLAVVLAQADTGANHSGIIGLVTENIDNNQEGFITTFGYVRNINTTGNLQLESWSDGDALWLSETNPGGLTNIEPSNHPVQIGWVTYSNANNGKIFVKVQEGVDELHELHDVTITSEEKGDTLEYDGSKWVNSGIVYTIELIDALTVDFYAPYDLKINSVTDILNSPTTTIEDDGVPYTLTNTILAGSKVTVTVDTAAVVNLNITKA